MFILYDLIFLVVAIIYLPIYVCRRKLHRGLLLRFGILPKDLAIDRPIWIHAVSVGEAMAVKALAAELRAIYPDKRFVISTVTPTGNKIARGLAKDGDFVTYLPFDFSFIVKSVIDKINPSFFIIAETEIWPNLISYLHKKNIPISVVNGRISDSSYRGYFMIRFLLKPILDKISLFCVQTNSDAERFKGLGVPEEKIKITGNMKFDIEDYADSKKDYADYRKRLDLEFSGKLLVAGSTHPGEEEIILNVYKDSLSEFPYLKLLIAPRHPERAQEIANLIRKFGFETRMISLSNSQTVKQSDSQTVFILDTMGQLINYYAIADIVFVGGSLIKKGGHNILEPASFAKPILFGPYMFNFRDIAELFLINQAAILVNNQEELKVKIKEFLGAPAQTQQMGQRAKELILDNAGATKRNAQLIKKL